MRRRNFFSFLAVSIFAGKSVCKAFVNNTPDPGPKIIESPLMPGPGLSEYLEPGKLKNGDFVTYDFGDYKMTMQYLDFMDSTTFKMKAIV